MERQRYFIITVVLGLMALFLYNSLYSELILAGRVILFVTAAGLALGVIIFLGVFGFKAAASVARSFELVKQARLETMDRAVEIRVKEMGSVVFNSAPAGHQVYAAHLSGGQVVIDPLHLAPGRVNGVAPAYDSSRWAMNLLTNGPRSIDPAQLAPVVHPALTPGLPERVDLAPYIAGGSSLRSIFLGLGRWPDGRVTEVRAPLDELVHIALAGATRSGKSTAVKSLAYQILEARENPRPVFLDAQGVALAHFAGDPRLLYPVAKAEDEIEGTLEALHREMARRLDLFTRFRGVENLRTYNRIIEEKEGPDSRLPAVPIIYDEFGINADNKHIAYFCRGVAAQGAKVGLAFVASCQTWLASDVGSAFRANLSTAIQFYVRDPNQSRLLIGSKDATSLTRPGQAFAMLPGQPGLIELQTPDPSGILDPLVGEPMTAPAQTIPQPSRAVTVNGWDAETVARVWEEERSLAAIARAHGKTPGGKQNEEIREILREAGIEL